MMENAVEEVGAKEEEINQEKQMYQKKVIARRQE